MTVRDPSVPRTRPGAVDLPSAFGMGAGSYWETHVLAGPFGSVEASEAELAKRNARYPGLAELMPTDGFAGKTVLDYGCGPGHDVILFVRGGASVLAHDASPLARDVVAKRLALHGISTRVYIAAPGDPIAPVDYVHCAGVLHHVFDPVSVLDAFAALLPAGGEARISVYDGEELPGGFDTGEGPTAWWTRSQVADLARLAGFACEYVGTYPLPMACYRLTRGELCTSL